MMRNLALVSALMLCLNGAVTGDDSHLEARQLTREGKILSLQQILTRIGEGRLGQILEVELEREHGELIYELELLDDEGVVWELKVDAVNGEILERELED